MSDHRRRRNSEEDDRRYTGHQYGTRHGAVPAQSLQREAGRASAYSIDPPTRSRFPHEYRNSEGPAGSSRPIYDTRFETRAPGPGGHTSRPLEEFPVGLPRQANHFDYDSRTARATRVDRVPQPRERAAAVGVAHPGAGDWPGARTRPPNDPGPLRGVGVRRGDQSLAPVGVMQHPEGNMRAFEAVPRQPIDRAGRRAADRDFDDRMRAGSYSYPPRSADSYELAGL
ncbi:hypothetical protein VMCG_01148 [Cytospora schulzeri]|uniref:Uncharacterized protein n=1 Tax=Cytospora schulzeri TaxID=448051 RepID=A0A423X6E5_9PEZI|nr:hypothetical protein VMCG_01148 [Valsa malicola]